MIVIEQLPYSAEIQTGIEDDVNSDNFKLKHPYLYSFLKHDFREYDPNLLTHNPQGN